MFKSIIAIAAFITSIMITANANATWSYYDDLNCNLTVNSWIDAEANDTDGVFGSNDIDRIQTVGESFTITDRIDGDSKYNIISISIPTYFYNLSGNLSYPTMYVTIISEHVTDPSQDYYFHSNALTILPSEIGGDEKLYNIGAVFQAYPSGAQQAPMPVSHRSFSVIIEIVAPVGVQFLVDQVRVNSTAFSSQEGTACAH